MLNKAMTIALLSALLIKQYTGAQAPPDAPRPPREAPAHFTLPEGFRATLFAGEPDVVQPIAMCFDDRGRLWVAECMSYPKWHADPKLGKDRILIFEDTDGDGQFDKRTIFADKLANVSGLQYGFGGVWVCSTPNLLYIPIKEGKDEPAGPPQIVLDGWDLKAQHNVFNSLNWGPDGWLYGCNGILSNSVVGPPGTPIAKRTKMNCGVWRYRPPLNPPLRKGGKEESPPLRKGGKEGSRPAGDNGGKEEPPPLTKGGQGGVVGGTFEVVAHGTTNPWGLDWDEYGQMFMTNCVIGHLWHVVPGGRYERMFGQDMNPHSYGLLKACSDHIHWGGGSWTSSRAPTGEPGSAKTGEPGSVRTGSEAYQVHSEAGGGHAHSGCMIYLGDNWPDRYRNGVFMCNLHGNRINHDILERKGSTYVARHGKDFMNANDPWFRGICLTYGPDGGVYVADWCDTGECHNYQVAHKTSGRIYKITYGKAKDPADWLGPKWDISKLSDKKLVELQAHKNDWFVRHARRVLQERAAANELQKESISVLREIVHHAGKWSDRSKRLKCLWSLYVSGSLDQETLREAISVDDEYFRYWPVQFLGDKELQTRHVLKITSDLAAREVSPLVRLSWASVLPKLPLDPKYEAAMALLREHQDSDDSYLPLMLWYGVEPMALLPSDEAAYLLVWSRIPLVREFLSRRMASLDDKHLNTILHAIGPKDPSPFHRDVLRGVQDAIQGRRSIPMPVGWTKVFPILMENPLAEVRERALAVAVQFGDKRALDMLRKTALDVKLLPQARQTALQQLVFNQGKDLVPLLHDALTDKSIRAAAIKGLAAFDDPKTPGLILKQYPGLHDDEKADAVQTLASRPAYALALLDAVETKTVARHDLSPYTVRQIQALKDAKVNERLTQVWGTLRDPSKDKAAVIGKWKKALGKDVMQAAKPASGRVLYKTHCAACHKLFGDGAAIAPDLTGSQRFNLDYVLENIIDPSAVVPREYQVSIFTTTGGRVLTGIVKQETDRAVTVQTQNELVILPKDEIDTRVQSKVSMMPEGLLDRLTVEEVRDLVAYLASPAQVPLSK